MIEEIGKLYTQHYILDQLLGDLAVAKNQTEQAIGHYQAALAQAKTPYLIGALIKQYQKTNATENAINLLTDYLATYPQSHAHRMQLALLYQQAGEYKQAIREYEQLRLATPENVVLLNNLGWLYWQNGDERSLETAKAAYELSPNRPEIIDTYGWIMLHTGDKKSAQDLIQKASSRAPTNPDIRYHLALAMHQNDQDPQSKKELARLLKDHSGFAEEESAKQLIKELKD